MRVHGLSCSKASASYNERCRATAHYNRSTISLITWREALSAWAIHVWFILAVSTRTRRCAQRTERNGGFRFQTKAKGRFINQRRWTCWYSCRKNMQVLSATASLVFILFLFWIACYLCCLPHVMLWRLPLNVFILLFIWFLCVCLTFCNLLVGI